MSSGPVGGYKTKRRIVNYRKSSSIQKLVSRFPSVDPPSGLLTKTIGGINLLKSQILLARSIYRKGIANQMRWNTALALRTTITFLLTISLTGCMMDIKWGSRGYSGNALPPQQVALVVLDKARIGGIGGSIDFADSCGCNWESIQDERGTRLEERRDVGIGNIIELLPGQYTLTVHYFCVERGYRTTATNVGVNLDAEAGHVYVICSDFPEPHSWRPIIEDVYNGRYDGSKCVYSSSPKPYPERFMMKTTELKELVDRYFQGERRPFWFPH